MMEYNEESFWAGVVLGQQLRGWATYGRAEGFDPDGDLILRPITQGIRPVQWKKESFSVSAFTDIVNEDAVFPVSDDEKLVQTIGVIVFPVNRFGLRNMTDYASNDEGA